MKVLLLNDYATPTAGAELLTLWLRDALRESGHDARVLASRAQLIPGPAFADADCFGASGRMQTLSALVNPSAARSLRRELESFRPDVVHVNMFMWQLSPSILPVLRTVPSVYYAMTYKAVCPTGSKQLPRGTHCVYPAGAACLRERCLTAAGWGPRLLQQTRWHRNRAAFDRVLAVSAAVRSKLEVGGVPVADVVSPGVPETAGGFGPTGRPSVTFAGRLAREKGVDVLLRAFRIVLAQRPDAVLLIAGTGPEEQRLRALAAELGLDDAVRWLGQLPSADLAARFRGAWAHAVPSTWAEPYGLTAAEAMMRGTAVVVSAVGGLAESVVDGRTGLHVAPNDPGALAEALARLLSNGSLAARMGATARAHALDELTIVGWVGRLLRHYRDLTTRAKRSAA